MKFIATEQNVDRVGEVVTEIDEHCHDMETKLTSIDASLVEIDGELEELSSDVAGVKSDVAGVKSDVADVKTDVADVKTAVYSVKNDVSSVKQDVARVKDDCESIGDTVDDIQNTVDNTRTTVNSIASDMATAEQIVSISSTMAGNQAETVGKLDEILSHFQPIGTKTAKIARTFIRTTTSHYKEATPCFRFIHSEWNHGFVYTPSPNYYLEELVCTVPDGFKVENCIVLIPPFLVDSSNLGKRECNFTLPPLKKTDNSISAFVPQTAINYIPNYAWIIDFGFAVDVYTPDESLVTENGLESIDTVTGYIYGSSKGNWAKATYNTQLTKDEIVCFYANYFKDTSTVGIIHTQIPVMGYEVESSSNTTMFVYSPWIDSLNFGRFEVYPTIIVKREGD